VQSIFGKHIFDLEITDIETYFTNRQEETSILEFKSGDVEINDVFKEIAAFLNTEGGVLIIGSPREKKETIGKNVIVYCQGEVTYSKFSGKDWLSQKIFSNITPSPTGVVVREFLSEKGGVFLIEVPQSVTPPHQSNSDGRYYIRIGNEARPAPHGLVQALFDKRRKPVLVSTIRKVKSELDTDYFDVIIQNTSPTPAEKICYIIDVYNVSSVTGPTLFDKINDEILGEKHSFSGYNSQVLVTVISLIIRIKVRNNKQKYVVSVSYWSRECDYNNTYFLIDPKTQDVQSRNWLDENINLIDQIRLLKEI
jgi:hypothetical protein